MLIGLSYQNASFFPIYLGVAKGFFADEGVELDYVYVQEGSKAKNVRLAMKGDLQFIDGVSTSVEAMVRGWGQVKVLCSGVRDSLFLMVRPPVEKETDLKGKRVIAGGEGGRNYNEVLYLCKRYGWEPGRDITIIKGSQANRIEAFQDPTIDAVAARVQFWHWAELNGFRRLVYEGGKCWYSGGIAAPSRLIEEQPRVALGVVTAYLKAIDYIKSHREESIGILLKEVPYLDQEGAAGNYDVLHGLWNPMPERAGIEYMAELCREMKGGTLKPRYEDLVDIRFLKKLSG